MTKTLNLSFPPQFGPVPIVGISTLTDGSPNDYLYLQAGLNAAVVGISAPYVTQVDSDVETPLIEGRLQSTYDADGHPSTRAYGGFAVSQNLINYYISSIWRTAHATMPSARREQSRSRGTCLAHSILAGRYCRCIFWPAVTPLYGRLNLLTESTN